MFAMGLGKDDRTMLLTAAALAPSLHNTQPWRFQVGSGTVRVYRDLDRWLRSEDPSGSGLYISLGAAILNVRVAAAELGRLAHVTVLPDPLDPDCVARMVLAEGLGRDPELAALFPYLSRRRTNRRPFADRPIPSRALRDMENAAHTDGARLDVVHEPERVRRLLSLAAEAVTNELFDADRLAERARWVGGERSEDGIPTTALGPRAVGALSAVRDLAVHPADRERPVARFEQHPVLAVLSTGRDDPVGWLAAGQAVERVLLTAARWGLSASFLNQGLADERLRPMFSRPGDHAQMVLRLGYAALPEPTPRRSYEALGAVPPLTGREARP